MVHARASHAILLKSAIRERRECCVKRDPELGRNEAPAKPLDPRGMCIIWSQLTHKVAMRTKIEIDDKLLRAATKATGQTTKRATVEAALRRAVKLHRQKLAGRDLAGIGWEGDLDAMWRDWRWTNDWRHYSANCRADQYQYAGQTRSSA
jgi:Arc/MetJ family transcription regulator